MRTRIGSAGCIAWLIAAGTALAVLVPTVGAGATSAGMSSASSSGTWSRLWWNRDQQGERLLDAGDAAHAALRFRDPQRRAYAELQAGRYAEAAQLLAPFKDALSQYNRGNALAHAGQLQAALTAYDAALARAPNDRDARHNRDLVARALARQQPQQRSQQQSQQQHGSASGAQHGSQGSAPHTSKRGDPQGHGGSAPKGASSSSGANRADAGHAASNQTPAGQAGAGQTGPSAAESQPAAGHKAAAGTQAATGNPTGRGPADTQAGAAPSRPAQSPQARSQPRSLTGSGGTATPKSLPPSEQALSLDQWLRRLPDDPGGLLRRKFLIEHLMRQNQQQGTP